ncbi:MAG: ABC transporter ATP-binding protein [Clostridiales bacterium]|nr:ABC transporter ATP-binding protein [Clostridiales bacterium]
MKKLFRYLAPYKWQVILITALTFVQAISQLYLPNLMSDIIDKGVVGEDVGFILETGAIMLGFTILVSICTIVARFFSAKVGVGFAKDLRRSIFVSVENYSLNEFDKIGTASLITRSTNDVTQIQNVMVMILNMLLMAPIMFVGGVIMSLQKDGPLTLILVGVVVILGILVLFILKNGIPLFKVMQKKLDSVNLVLREGLTGMRVIRAFNKTEYEKGRFDVANKDLTNNAIKVYRIMSVAMPAIMLLMNVTLIAIIWFGAKRIDAGAMMVGDLMAFQQYAMQIMFSLIMATMMFVMLPRAQASAVRVNEILDMELSVTNPKNPIDATDKKGYIDFQDVSFKYQGAQEPVLCNISFSAKPGETTAIIGGTGSGKSTLINLIPRFYDVASGKVLVDGVDVKDMDMKTLRDKIGLVPQKINLFQGTIEDNVRFGKEDANQEEINIALETAQAKEFVDDIDEGSNAEVSQGGTNFSGGQKQRLSIARAIIRRPEIYIFDDSFSALDFKTDARLRMALTNEIQDSTVLIVAQRVSTVMNANNIIVLDNGMIVGQGTHSKLLDSCEIYREIVSSQLSEEELA